MSVDIRRSRSLKDQDLRRTAGTPKREQTGAASSDQESRASDRSDSFRRPNRSVSFNRDVHVKRFARKLDKQLSRIDESPAETSDDMKDVPMKRRGRGDGTEEVRNRNETSASFASQKTTKNSGKEGLTQKIKAFFSGKSKSKNTKSSATATDDDDLSSRYREYRAETDYGTRSRRRDSAPDAKQSWFRSLERTRRTDSRADEVDSGRFSRSERNLKYFGESDNERFSSLARNRSRSRYLDDTSQDDTTDVDVPNRYGSLVYLHAAAVRDIPPRSRLGVRDEPDPSTLRRKTKKSLTRSLSMSGPWTPQHKPVARTPTANYSPAKDIGIQTMSRNRGGQRTFRSLIDIDDPADRRTDTVERRFRSETPRPRKLPELVFTGPSIEHTLRREWRGRV